MKADGDGIRLQKLPSLTGLGGTLPPDSGASWGQGEGRSEGRSGGRKGEEEAGGQKRSGSMKTVEGRKTQREPGREERNYNRIDHL